MLRQKRMWTEIRARIRNRSGYVHHNAGTPITVRYARAEAEVITGQAKRATSNTGLTALNAVSMGLTKPDPDHPCEIIVPDTVSLHRCGVNLFDISAYSFSDTLYEKKFNMSVEGDSIRIWTPEALIPRRTYSVQFAVVQQEYGLNKLSEKIKVKTVIDGVYTGTQCSVRFTNTLLHSGLAIDMGTDDQGMFDATFKVLVLVQGTENPHEAYEGERYTISLPADFAGGAIEAYSGKVLNGWKRFDLAISAMRNDDSYPGWSLSADDLDGIVESDRDYVLDARCNIASKVRCNSKSLASSGRAGIYFYKSFVGGLTTSELKAAYPDLTATINIKRVQPIVYDITAQSIPAIPGVNTITTDATTLTVSGHADPIRIITNLTERVAALEDAAATE